MLPLRLLEPPAVRGAQRAPAANGPHIQRRPAINDRGYKYNHIRVQLGRCKVCGRHRPCGWQPGGASLYCLAVQWCARRRGLRRPV